MPDTPTSTPYYSTPLDYFNAILHELMPTLDPLALPPSIGQNGTMIDYLHAIWKAIQAGGLGGGSISIIPLTATTNAATLTNAALIGIVTNKIIYIERSGTLYNVVNAAPNVRECQIDNVAGSLTVNANEAFFIGEVITLKILA